MAATAWFHRHHHWGWNRWDRSSWEDWDDNWSWYHRRYAWNRDWDFDDCGW